jgi:two-component system sensor histidine kinase QseC
MASTAAGSSIRRRLLVTLLGTVAMVWLATASYSYWDARREVNELFDAHLAQSAALLVAQAGHELDEIDLEHVPQLHRYEHRVAFQIWENGKVLRLHSINAPNERLSPREEGFSDSGIGDKRWRVFSSWDAERRLLIQVGEQLQAREEIAARIGTNLVTPLLFALAVLGLLIYLGVSRGTRPLAIVSQQVAQRDPENLRPIEVAECPAEVAPLVDGLNRLFQRVSASIENERRFTADAAHELRTPIAALRVQAEVARAATSDGERRHALDNVIAGCDRAGHMIEQLLILARLDPAYVRLTRGPCDLHALAKSVIADIAPAGLAKDVEVELDDSLPTLVRGDAGLLAILIRNLVDNAVRYSPPRTKVRVRTELTTADDRVELTVTDQGPGVPANQLQTLGSRFYRALGSGQSGSGLGLSIVKRIAELHAAAVRFEGGLNGAGLRVTVVFETQGTDDSALPVSPTTSGL